MTCYVFHLLTFFFFYVLGQNRLHLGGIVSVHETQVWLCGLENISRALHRKHDTFTRADDEMGSSLSDGISIKNSMGASGAEIVTAWLGILQEYAISCHLRRKNLRAARSGKLLQSHTLMERCRGEFLGQSGGRGVRGEKEHFPACLNIPQH